MKDIISVHSYRYHSAYYEIFIYEIQSGEWKWAVNIIDRKKSNGLLWRHVGVEPTEEEARAVSQGTVKERMIKYAPSEEQLAAKKARDEESKRIAAEERAAGYIHPVPE